MMTTTKTRFWTRVTMLLVIAGLSPVGAFANDDAVPQDGDVVPQSLSEHIREFANGKQSQDLSMLLVSRLSEDDELPQGELPDDESRQGKLPSEEKPDDEEIRAATMRLQLARLRKPITDIQLIDAGSKTTPVNQAASLAPEQLPSLVGSLGFAPPPPDRYTIQQYHRPLYFEQPNLERCGNGFGILQNGISAATFVGNTIAWPFRAYHQPPDCLVKSGDDCKTCQFYRLPYKWFRPTR